MALRPKLQVNHQRPCFSAICIVSLNVLAASVRDGEDAAVEDATLPFSALLYCLTTFFFVCFFLIEQLPRFNCSPNY